MCLNPLANGVLVLGVLHLSVLGRPVGPVGPVGRPVEVRPVRLAWYNAEFVAAPLRAPVNTVMDLVDLLQLSLQMQG